MTKEEMLTFIEDKIRKDIPRLSTIGGGCYINFINKNGEKEKGKIVKLIYRPSENISDTQELYAVLITSVAEQDYNTYFLGIHGIEIVGHEITILDILNWLEDYYYYITPDGAIYEHDSTYSYNSSGFIYLCSFDMSKPLLKDQPEKLIKFLYNLKNDKIWK